MKIQVVKVPLYLATLYAAYIHQSSIRNL